MADSKIQMVDLRNQYLNIKDEIDSAINGVLNNTSFIQGPNVKELEGNLANYTLAKKVVSCGNGTDALQISMMALGFQQDDEIILPAHTYVATAEVIALLKLRPIFVDVNYNTFNLDLNKIKDRITPKTKAIVPVHLYGQCAEMEELLSVSKEHNLKIIEDTAQAIGAKYTFSDGTTKMAGTMGDIGCLSFFPSKNLGCYGDGGAMLFNNLELANKAKMISNHGQQTKYKHDLVGCNSRLDTLQAAILNVKLKYLDEYIQKRQIVARKYNEAFGDIDEILIPEVIEASSHVYHQYTIRVVGIDRDELKNRLQEKGIPSMIYYPIPLHLQKAFRSNEFPEGSLPITEKLSKQVLSLPIHTEMKDEHQTFIIETILKTIKG